MGSVRAAGAAVEAGTSPHRLIASAFHRVELATDEPRTLRASLEVHGTDDYSRAHFPQFPIVAGVFTLENVSQLVLEAVGVCGALSTIHSVHFYRLLIPGERIDVTATIEERNDTLCIKARCEVGNELCARLHFEIEVGHA